MKIQLVYFEGCPNVDRARAALRDAMAAEHVDGAVEEIDVEAAGAPEALLGWGSPTILVDGVDVSGATRSTGSACRLYTGGAPSVDQIRTALVAAKRALAAPRRGAALPMVGAIAAALAASACCVVPALLAVVGLSGAGLGAALAPYRVLFLLATAVALAVGFLLVYRRPKETCGCPAPRSRRFARVALWITAAGAIALAGYPLLGSGVASAGSSQASAKATLHLTVSGMDCAECTGGITARLKEVPGVVSASVNYESGAAVVRHDGRPGITEAAIAAVREAGFSAKESR